MGIAIYQAQLGSRHRYAKPLEGFGPGVLEVIATHDGGPCGSKYLKKGCFFPHPVAAGRISPSPVPCTATANGRTFMARTALTDARVRDLAPRQKAEAETG